MRSYTTTPEGEKYMTTQHERDAETGLDYRGARFYDCEVGRFLSEDPLAGKFPRFSTFCYVNGNPNVWVDCNGKEPTPWEAAMLSKAVYGDAIDWSQMNGWKVSSFQHGLKLDSPNGFLSQVYEREGADGKMEYVCAFAGTVDGVDVVSNVLQLLGNAPQYVNATNNAELLSEKLGSNELTFVGHSLGGGLATAAAMYTTTPRNAITINPAWLSTNTINEFRLTAMNETITNYVVNGEILDYIQSESLFLLPELKNFGADIHQIGTTHYMPSIEAIFSPFGAHMIDSAIEEIYDEFE